MVTQPRSRLWPSWLLASLWTFDLITVAFCMDLLYDWGWPSGVIKTGLSLLQDKGHWDPKWLPYLFRLGLAELGGLFLAVFAIVFPATDLLRSRGERARTALLRLALSLSVSILLLVFVERTGGVLVLSSFVAQVALGPWRFWHFRVNGDYNGDHTLLSLLGRADSFLLIFGLCQLMIALRSSRSRRRSSLGSDFGHGAA